MVAVTHVDKLSRDAQFIAGFANASFQHCLDMQLITDFTKNFILVFPFESER